ncbi:MAG TPA: MGMT family protein [Candidatus Polarisedimenticolia bacterium]|nr:MGMT family protein [Candidatus Polarisedimenticolia bacterium]
MPPTSKRSGSSRLSGPPSRAGAHPGRGAFPAIYAVVARIPRGRIATYGQVARMAGMPGAARTVGWAMAALPNRGRIAGRAIPWHRVLNAQGGVSPRPSETPGRPDGQAARLRREGLETGKNGRFDLERYGWDGTGRGSPKRSGRSG